MVKKKHPGGRPPKFKNVEEMQSAIDEYFDHCDNRIMQVYSKAQDAVIEIIKPEPYTIEGLCLTLDMSRQSLLDYQKKDEFIDAIKKAKMKVQKSIVLNSIENQPAGAIFNLKNNFGYRDKQEISGDPDAPLIHTIERVIIKNDKKSKD